MFSIQIYDTTLRDGSQREGISFTVEDKIRITQKLDELGVHFIEGGWPGSNPKDTEFFSRARSLRLKHASLVAFGSTKQSNSSVETDINLAALLKSGATVVTIVGKSWDIHVTQVLETTLEENLKMVEDSVRFLKGKGITTFFDAEHFFDGYKANRRYSLAVVDAAARGGADCIILCDTNGGSLTGEVAYAVQAVRKVTRTVLGIHAHNDGDLAVANSLMAVECGVTQVQGTINGYGERCGNANLCSIIPALKIKLGIDCVTKKQLGKLAEVSRYVAEIANLVPDSHQPYVGKSAFAHKAGLHVSGLLKWAESYHHIKPELVGNQHRVVVSELSGKGNIIYKARQRGVELPTDRKKVRQLLERIKQLESEGFQYEAAEASFELLARRALPDYRPPFELVDFMVIVERHRRPSTASNHEDLLSEATVKVRVGDEIMHTAAEGNGPVNALDQALRRALIQFYPGVANIKLIDYKVRILEESSGTGSKVRVLIESTDGREQWRTVGSSANIIEASWLALADSLEYYLLKQAMIQK